MINWLVQSNDAHPDLGTGRVPEGLLGVPEQQRYNDLKTEKRRSDWLLGRWTAKHLARSVLNGHANPPGLDSFCVLNEASGAPYLTGSASGPVSLSISHSHDHAFCAVVERRGWPLGADIERVEHRSLTFAQDYFTDAEMAMVTGTPVHTRDMLITAIWSAKEAVLKAYQVGLTVDTRAVSCTISPVTGAPSDWTPFYIECDACRLRRPDLKLAGWWRTLSHFVLTLVTRPAAMIANELMSPNGYSSRQSQYVNGLTSGQRPS